MENLMLFVVLYHRMLENEARRCSVAVSNAEPLEPILWHRIHELMPGRLQKPDMDHVRSRGRCMMAQLDHAAVRNLA